MSAAGCEGAVIRPATAKDVAAIRAVAHAAYALYLPRMDRKPAPMVADFAAHVARGEVHVVDSQGQVLGYIVMMPGKNTEAGCLFVENVAVHPGHQGRGLGRCLIAFAEERARRLDLAEVSLYTNVVMTENLEFYSRLGFAETRRVREHGFNRVYMAKRIGEQSKP